MAATPARGPARRRMEVVSLLSSASRLWTDGGHTHHASGVALFGTMGEQQVGLARRAERDRFDAPGGDARIEQLAAVRFHQIQEEIHGRASGAPGARSS